MPTRRGALSLLFLGVALVAARPLRGQVLTPTSNLWLRDGPLSTATKIRLIPAGEFLELVPPDTLENDFLHVRTELDEEGWLSRFFTKRLAPQPPVLIGDPALPKATILGRSHPAEAVQQTWSKPPIRHTTYASVDSHGAFMCGPAGSATGDTLTNERKNRADVPSVYHAVTLGAIADTTKLRWPHEASTLRTSWTQDELSAIRPFEGIPVTVTGFLVAVRREKREATNCGHMGGPNVDFHLALVAHPDDAESDAVVAETTPRFRQIYEDAWSVTALGGSEPHPSETDSVRISGFLMLDPRHPHMLGEFRRTLWEIHPVTRIEVFRDGEWKELVP